MIMLSNKSWNSNSASLATMEVLIRMTFTCPPGKILCTILLKTYVPASLDNLTQVVEYVLDYNNQQEMKLIVNAANSWISGCK